MLLGRFGGGKHLTTPWTFIVYYRGFDWIAKTMFVKLVNPQHSWGALESAYATIVIHMLAPANVITRFGANPDLNVPAVSKVLEVCRD